MNNERRTGRVTGWVIISFFLAFTVFACKKTGSTQAVVTVLDGNTKAPVSGATVTLWQDTAVNNTNGVQSTLRRTGTTDASGRATFDFELEAFLNVEVVKGQDTGRSYIRLKEHETEEVTVNL
jgi:hypothetical protein